LLLVRTDGLPETRCTPRGSGAAPAVRAQLRVKQRLWRARQERAGWPPSMDHVSRWRSLHHWAQREAESRRGARPASCHRITGISPTAASVVGRSIRSGSSTFENTESTGLRNQAARCLLGDSEVTREVARRSPRVPMEPIEIGHLLQQLTSVLGSLAAPHGDHAGAWTTYSAPGGYRAMPPPRTWAGRRVGDRTGTPA
jgi:hypothetical protein